MAVETPEQFNKRMLKKLRELETDMKIFGRAVGSSVALVAQRAFSGGQNNVGANFRYNDMDPLYVQDDQSPRKLSHKGKFGRKKFASGKKKGLEHKTTYFASYKEFRETVKRESNYVNWQLTGDLMSDFANFDTEKSTPSQVNKVGKKAAEKLSPKLYITGLSRDINIKKYAGLAERYGDFLKVSDEEEKKFREILEKDIANFLST